MLGNDPRSVVRHAASGPAESLLRFVAETRDENLPKSALEHARLAVLDWWGVTVGGADEPVARILLTATERLQAALAALDHVDDVRELTRA